MAPAAPGGTPPCARPPHPLMAGDHSPALFGGLTPLDFRSIRIDLILAGKAQPRSTRRRRRRVGKGVIVSKTRQRRAKGSAVENSWQATFKVKRDLAYDIDVRALVAHVSVGMAKYYRDKLKAGERANGFGPLRRVNDRTKSLSDSRVTDKMGGRSGYMADHWWLGKIRGGGIKAKRLVKPYGGDGGPEPRVEGPGRDLLLNVLLKKGIDFQSVQGEARKEIYRLMDEWLKQTIGENPGVDRVDGAERLLPEAQDELA